MAKQHHYEQIWQEIGRLKGQAGEAKSIFEDLCRKIDTIQQTLETLETSVNYAVKDSWENEDRVVNARVD